MHLAFVKRLGLVIQTTNVGTQKINGTTLETYKMMILVFSVIDQVDKVTFFEKTFLVANVSPDMVFGIPFLSLSDEDVDFPKKELWWRLYTIKEALPTSNRVELVGKKEFQLQLLIWDIRPL